MNPSSLYTYFFCILQSFTLLPSTKRLLTSCLRRKSERVAGVGGRVKKTPTGSGVSTLPGKRDCWIRGEGVYLGSGTPSLASNRDQSVGHMVHPAYVLVSCPFPARCVFGAVLLDPCARSLASKEVDSRFCFFQWCSCYFFIFFISSCGLLY